MRCLHILIACATVLAPGARADEKTVAAEQKALEGAWMVDSYTLGGQPFPDLAPKKLVFKEGKLEGLDPSMALPIRFDPSQKPKAFDAIDKRGEPQEIPFIYELTGDKLRLAMPLPDPSKKGPLKRPQSFDTEQKLIILITAHRAK